MDSFTLWLLSIVSLVHFNGLPVTPFLGRCILWLLGMDVPKDTVTTLHTWIQEKRKVVILFPHSSIWDSFYQIVFATAYKCPGFAVGHECWEHHPIVGPFLRYNGIIFVNPKIDGDMFGTTQQVIDRLKKEEDGFLLWISPTGGRVNRPWRTGYKFIAEATGAYLAVAGVDYEHHQIQVSPLLSHIEYNSPYEVTSIFASIVPLHPDLSYPRTWVNLVDPYTKIPIKLVPFRHEIIVGIAITSLFAWIAYIL